jgi:steroid 5-alpha reductase family enzyme
MFFPTEWNLINIAFYGVFGVFAVLLGFLDYYEWWAMRYSKFNTKAGVPSRIGMFILYFLPVIISSALAWNYLPKASLTQWIIFAVVILHFVKRTLEVLFVHKYSGSMEPLTFGVIVVTYSLIAGMITMLNGQVVFGADVLFWAGILLFVIGEVGSFYHHKLLADLRKKDKEYHLPKGGWFEYATCPHYFFELLAWLGLLLLSRQFFTLLAFIAMLGYLSARSIKTRQWYCQRFKKYPAKRKYMIPFVF